MPLIGFHDVIDRPDSVSRVMPPTATIATISAATIHSHRATLSGRALERNAALVWSIAST